jgi:hypothetical protein
VYVEVHKYVVFGIFEEDKQIKSESENRSESLCLTIWYSVIVLVLSNNLVNY